MPDPSHGRERDDRLEDIVAAAEEGPLGQGIRQAPNKQSYIVNIRPRRWKDKFKPSQFWKGKIRDRGFAMLVADTIFHYCGRERCHFGDNAPFTFPSLRNLPLSTPAERSRYVESIAGSEFRLERQAFIDQVMAVIDSRDFIMRGERFLGIAPAAEVVAVPSSSEECEVDFEEDDDARAMTAQCASGAQPGASVAGFELDIGWGFDAGWPARIQSVQQRLDEDSGHIRTIEELNKSCVMVDQTEVFTSTAVDVSSPVFENISFLPGTNFLVIG